MLCLYFLLLIFLFSAAKADVSKHSVTWNDLLAEPGTASSGEKTYQNAMPIGNGHMAAVVNYESAQDTVVFLIAASSSWAESGDIMKVAQLNINLPSRGGAALPAQGFSQTFNPQDATVTLNIPAAGSAPALTLVTYVDANSDNLVVSVTPPSAQVTASLKSLHPTELVNSHPYGECIGYNVSADVVAANGALIYHRHTTPVDSSYMVNALRDLNIPLVTGFSDPMTNRASGVYLSQLTSSTASVFSATLRTSNEDTAQAYEMVIAADASAFSTASEKTDRYPPAAHVAWWAEKWATHDISVSSTVNPDQVQRVSEMYVWQRFIELSQARSPFPIKFNGMLYTANRDPNTDARQWGGLNWWQNARLPYYNMLTAGDSDELKSFLMAYNNSVEIAKSRTRNYFGFDGFFWPEYTNVFYGSQHSSSYRSNCDYDNASKPIWHADDIWNGYNYQGSLDLSLFALDYYAYTGDSSFLHIPRGVVQFYSNRFGNSSAGDVNNTMVIFPTQAIETWQCPGWPVDPDNCPTNDMPTVAGLHSVLEKLIRLPASVASQTDIDQWTKLKARVPPLPNNNGSYMPCDDCSVGGTGPGQHTMHNSENADLYAVHPYRMATVARGDQDALTKAQATFKNEVHTGDTGWNQNAMDAALVGDVQAAVSLVLARANTAPALGYRFPAFAPHEQDYEPSSDHFGVFQNALQYMLIQQKDDEDQGVLLLPTWPCDWDVEFTLSAPQQTSIVGSVVNGTLNYKVTPAARASAVSAARCRS